MSQRRPRSAAGLNDRLVLCYHQVSDDSRSTLTVPSAVLRRQLTTLLARGYEPVTLRQAVEGGARAQSLVITFDDADRNVLEHALPVLAELAVLGTVFVPVGYVGGTAMSWDDLALLAAAGWEIGSHSVSHVPLPDLEDAALDRELRGSREAIEDALGIPCSSVAYPYGQVDARVRTAAERAGFVAGCTTDGRFRAGDPLLIPRVGIDGRDSDLMFRIKTSREGRALRGSVLRGPISQAGRAARAFVAG
jgi:peptidoglycan/xylan/chitin deacetylase (PgdA/CDA1 family)